MGKRSRREKQLALVLEPRTWGGKRKGAGRKPVKAKRRNVRHRPREPHKNRNPLHVVMRGVKGLPSFRSQVILNLVKRVIARQRKRAYDKDFSIAHFSIQRDHIHFIVEGNGDAIRTGIAGFAISFAKRLNKLLGRKGKVWGDRHFRKDLKTPTEVRNTIFYVLQNWKHHGTKVRGNTFVDPFATGVSWFQHWTWYAEDFGPTMLVVDELAPPDFVFEPWPPRRNERTWLLREGWLRAGGPFHVFADRADGTVFPLVADAVAA